MRWTRTRSRTSGSGLFASGTGNDLEDRQLLIASEASKSDSGPAAWKPTNHGFWCTYAKDYTHIKSVWKLTTTDEEQTALSSMLDTCTD
ncbi:hypothetical protein [Streptomyces echinatus]|uniref:hypothetical protein n=1 Tax=Streptomyces echinatus TaxID=67293 RepID=UPI00379C10B0